MLVAFAYFRLLRLRRRRINGVLKHRCPASVKRARGWRRCRSLGEQGREWASRYRRTREEARTLAVP